MASRPLPKRYLWDHQAWQWQPPSTGLVPDTAAFTKAKNDRAMSFAIHAIAAQPLAYLHVVAKDALHPFVGDSTLDFPAGQTSASGLSKANLAYALAAVRGYTGNAAGIGPYLGHHYGYRLRQPFGRLMNDYQRVVLFPGPLFGLILIAGLAGILIPAGAARPPRCCGSQPWSRSCCRSPSTNTPTATSSRPSRWPAWRSRSRSATAPPLIVR